MDMGVLASRFTNVAVLRLTPPEFDGSLFELYSVKEGHIDRVSRLRVPFRTHRTYQWYASRLPLLLINTSLMLLLAVRARKFLGANDRGTSGLGIGWASSLVLLLMKEFRLIDTFAYYRVDWFVGRPNQNYDYLIVNVFFRFIDQVLSQTANFVWNITNAVRVAAKRTYHYESRNELVVMPPVNIVPQLGNSHWTLDPYIIYCGEVKHGCGLPMILDALRILQAENKTVKLKVLGRARGDYLTSLLKDYSDLFNSGVCQYLGGFDLGDDDDRDRVNRIVADAYAGVAIYQYGQKNTSNYVVPNRILLYLANHTPVLVNDDSAIADLLCPAGVAVAASLEPESIAKSVLAIWESSEQRSWLRSNIGPFMAKFANTAPSVEALQELTTFAR